MSNHIVVVGSCMIDFMSYTPQMPTPGETIHGSKFITGFGGKGANQCVAAGKLGAKTYLVARVGEDHWGDTYIQNLKEAKVDTTYVQKTKGEQSGIAQILVDENGENQIVIVAGANHKLSPEDVMKAKDVIANAKVLILQMETPIEASMKAMELATGTIILNGAPAVKNVHCCALQTPTIFCVNESEASIFTGMPVENKEQAKKAIKALLEKGCQSVMLTLGPEGAIYATSDSPEFHQASAPKVQAVDSTGAGDSFIGALAYMLAERSDLSVPKCMEVACAIAAMSVQKPGTQSSYPDKSVLPPLFKKLNI